MKNKYIYLLAGASGSGKSTVANILEKQYGWKNLNSYTTRKPRYKHENGHIFVNKEEFDKLENKVAYTMFDNHEYCATAEQVENADIYIIDPKGIDYFSKNYNGNKIALLIYLTLPDGNAIFNMGKRGDNYDAAYDRYIHDKVAFANMNQRLKSFNMPYMIYESNEINTPQKIAEKINADRERRF